MISFNSTLSKFTATVQADAEIIGGIQHAACFSRSKTMLRIVRNDNTTMSVYTISFSGLFGSAGPTPYWSDSNGVLEIPLHNIVNYVLDKEYNAAICAISLYEVGGNTVVDALSFNMVLYRGISYNDAVIPRNKDCQQFFAAYGAYVMPPNVILNPVMFAGVSAEGCIVESNYSGTWTQIAGGVSTVITPSGDRSNQLSIAAASDTLRLVDGADSKDWRLEKPDYCTDLLAVRWVSQTGAMRQHYFPIVSVIKGNDKTVSLMSAGDGYAVEKNNYNAVRCRLTGLTAYGYYYYMDLLQASEVHGLVRKGASPWNVEMSSPGSLIYIEGDSIESPQGNGFFTFEFVAKLLHYGTL